MSESDPSIRELQRIWRRHGVYLDRLRGGHPLTQRQLEDPYQRVALTVITSRADAKITYHVSTIGLGRPNVFETTVFASVHRPDQRLLRYATQIEAQRGHDEIVTLVAANLDDPVIDHNNVDEDQ